MTGTPLNGSKTHPLTPVALAALNVLAKGPPQPFQNFNAGVVNRLFREDLVEEVMLPSPFKTHRGKLLRHMKITDAGIAEIARHNL